MVQKVLTKISKLQVISKLPGGYVDMPVRNRTKKRRNFREKGQVSYITIKKQLTYKEKQIYSKGQVEESNPMYPQFFRTGGALFKRSTNINKL